MASQDDRQSLQIDVVEVLPSPLHSQQVNPSVAATSGRPGGVVRPTACYRLFSWSAFVTANITCVCHMAFVILLWLKVRDGRLGESHAQQTRSRVLPHARLAHLARLQLGRALPSLSWLVVFAPEAAYHLLVCLLIQALWLTNAVGCSGVAIASNSMTGRSLAA